jgi:hypothetical protein
MERGQEATFFVPYPFTWTYRALDQAGFVDTDLRASVRRAVARSFRARDLSSVNNQTLQRAAGLGLAAQTWPDLPEARSWKDYAEAIERMQASIEDVPENSTNYNTFDVVFTFLLADITGHPELVRSHGIHAMYLRFRDQVSPAGFIPPYGDAGAFAAPYNSDWPIENPWAMYVTAFHRAAREYSDRTFDWAADRLASFGMAHEPLARSYTGIIDLFYFSFSEQPSREPAVPNYGSAILTRADSYGGVQWDKLILAPSRQPGAPFLMSDLYVRGNHAHENQHGAVTYFEFDGVPLISALGYNNREPEEASLVMMRPASDPFPALGNLYPAGEWREVQLPTSRMPAPDPAKPYLRVIDGLNLRIESHGVRVWASDFRLIGAGGARNQVLGAGDAPGGWSPPPAIEENALTWDVPQGIHFHTKSLHAEFDCRQYPTLAFRWKLSNNKQWARPIILRVYSGKNATDYHAEAVQLQPVLSRAHVEQRSGDQYGVMDYTGWMTADTTLERQMILTRSGVLIVHDRLKPGPLAKGMAAGPIWQMMSPDAPRQSGNWFYSAGNRVGLIAWLGGTGSGLSFGTQTTDVWSKQDQQTIFVKKLLQPGEPVGFISVLVPVASGSDAAVAAAGIEVENAQAGVAAKIRTPRETMIVRIADGDKWSVERQSGEMK